MPRLELVTSSWEKEQQRRWRRETCAGFALAVVSALIVLGAYSAQFWSGAL